MVTVRPDAEQQPQELQAVAFDGIRLKLILGIEGRNLALSYTVGIPNDNPKTRGVLETKDIKGTCVLEPEPVAALTDMPKGEWHWMLGPANCYEGVASGEALVTNPQDAKLVWVSDDDIPIGRGADLRGVAKRLVDEPLAGGWAGPLLAEGPTAPPVLRTLRDELLPGHEEIDAAEEELSR